MPHPRAPHLLRDRDGPPPAPPAAAGATDEMRASDEDIFVDALCQAGGRAGGRACWRG